MNFYQTVTAAVADIARYGYDSPQRVEYWIDQIRRAARENMISEERLVANLTGSLETIYRRMVDRGGLQKLHVGIPLFTIEKVKPALRAELSRSIMASAGLIKLNRESALTKTEQRFAGWASSVPVGGSKVVDKRDTKDDIRKSLASLPFEERRVVIDQGHKFAASLSRILATDGGAIAAEWEHHHVRYPRPEHLARDRHVFLIRDSWAHKAGLVKPDSNGYTDGTEQPGERVLCRCTYRYIYNLRDLPDILVTNKGRAELERARAA